MQEQLLIEVAHELRRLTQRVEAAIAARQCGELFVGLDDKVHLPCVEEASRWVKE